MSQSQLVGSAYDKMLEKYQAHRSSLSTNKYISRFNEKIPKQAAILDIGCGSGDPVDKELIRLGHLVTGLDISKKQIEKARKNCPRGSFKVQNLLDLRSDEYQVDAATSFYALFHVPRDQHLRLLTTIATFLPRNGWFLLTMGDRDFEGFHELCGERVWSSHFGPQTNKKLLQKAGFKIDFETIDRSGNESHQIILAWKD